jgi:hypothetical protein
MRSSRFRFVPALGLVAVLLLSSVASAHDGAHPDRGGSKEMFPGEGVLSGDQHGGTDGHLPPARRNVTLVGKAEVTNPSGAGNEGRVADVFARGNYAYLTAFREPTCENAGVHVMDIHDLRRPFEVTDAFIPTSVGSYAGEGIQVIPMRNQFFKGDLLIHQNETCPNGPPPTDPALSGGISLWDVSDPTDPQPVTLHTGDFTNPAGGTDPGPNQTHSMYAWTNRFDRRTYVALIDDEEFTDIDILDITDPFNPVLVNDTLDLVELFGVEQESPSNLTEVFSHDMVVQKIGQRYVMNVNYWDGGYVLLDVTNPAPGEVELIAESDYAELDEERLARGHEISPEGNSHQSELSPDRKFLIGTDEDFNAYRAVATIDTGPFAGTEYTAVSASGTPPVDPDTTITGPTTFVGLACDPLAAGTGTALVERGVCSFQQKLDNITAAGYSAGIVFNTVRPDCQGLVFMGADGTIPYVFVDRLTGLQLLGQTADPATVCEQASPPGGSPSEATTIEAVFDGWGYVRLFRTDIPGRSGQAGSISQIDTYTIPEAQDEAFASGFGDLSVHEVAMDPDKPIAYLSYYAGGFRVVSYGRHGLREVGKFIDEGGNNFWGVEVYERHGRNYVLASDRDFGLYIFRYTP